MTQVRSSILGSGLLAVVLTAGVLAPGAQAEPDDPETPSASDVRAAKDRAAAAKSDVEVVQQQLIDANADLETATTSAARAAEAWNGARWAASQARARKTKAIAASKEADRVLVVVKADYRSAVLTGVGTSSELATLKAITSSDGMATLLERSAATDHVQGRYDQQREDYTRASATAEKAEKEATAASRDAEQKLADARVARDRASSTERAAAAAAVRISQRRATLLTRLARLQGTSVALATRRQDALEAARAKAARAKARAATKPVRTADPNPADPPRADPGPAPAPGNGARAAIAFARAQLGERYQWGAAGPNAWDCSGLTAKAWAAGGTSLPHYSVAQYDASTPISAGDLRPGDLVFWGDNADPGSIYHVALYVGNERIIHAPRTGRPVTEESLYYWRTPDFYARP